MGKRISVSPPAASGRAVGLRETSQVQPSSTLGALFPGPRSWFLSTISHSNHIFKALKKSPTACSGVWDHRGTTALPSRASMLPTCPHPSPGQDSSVARPGYDSRRVVTSDLWTAMAQLAWLALKR